MEKQKPRNPTTLSHSQIEHGRCLYRYLHGYINKEVELASGPGITKGSFIHQVVADYVKYCVTNKVQGDFEKFNEIFKARFKSFKVPEEYYKELWEQSMEFGAKSVHFENVLDIENKFKFEIDPGKIITGVIDITRLYHDENLDEDVLNIIDYKNQANILKVDEIPTEQLRIYTIPIFLMYPGIKYFRRGIYYLKYNFIQQEPEPVSRMDIAVEIDATKEMLLRQWDRIRNATSHPPQTGEHCFKYGGCVFLKNKECPKFNDINKNKPTDIENKIRKCKEHKLLAKELEAEIKEGLKSECITVDDKEVGYALTEETKYNLNQFVEFAKKYDIDLSELNVSKTQAEKLIKKFQRETANYDIDDFDGRVEKMQDTKKITKFKGLTI